MCVREIMFSRSRAVVVSVSLFLTYIFLGLYERIQKCWFQLPLQPTREKHFTRTS